jgi:phage recombination protein Bet
LTMNDLQVFRDSDLALIRKTVARDCEPAEFDQFIHICKAVKLDPLRRQIYAFVFGKGKKDSDRKLTVVTGIDGYRAISERSGAYRPDDRAARIEYDPDLKSPANPLGIVRAEVTLYKYAHGDWHPVPGEAYWDEFCPTAYRDEDCVWTDTGDTWPDGKPKRKKVPKEDAVLHVDQSKTGWVKSPRNQISKCAEAQAHRKGWPNDFAGLELQEEVDRRHTIDLTASEIADKAEIDDRIARIGGPDTYITDWLSGPLEAVPGGQYVDRVLAMIRECEGQPSTIAAWRERNRVSFNQFWAAHKGDAHKLKKELEKAEAQIVEDDLQIDLEQAIAAAGGGK